MSYTQTEIVGFGRNVLELVDEVEKSLAGTGLNFDEIQEILTKKLETAENANARQERLKKEAQEATQVSVRTHDDLYRTSSGILDALIGAAGKGSPAAKTMQRLRSRIRAPGDQTAEATTPGGTPPEGKT